MRGDRPETKMQGGLWSAATPHARGSTSFPHFVQVLVIGYPACAGIDLSAAFRRTPFWWLPRMRGDRPG